MIHLSQRLGIVLGCLCISLAGCTRPGANQIESAIETETTAANQLLHLGLEFSEHNDSYRAEQYLAAAIEEGADPDIALPPLLRSCVRSGRYQAAAKYAEDNLNKVRAKREIRMTLAALLLALEKQPEALEHLQRVTRNYPDYPMGHFLLGRLLLAYSQDVERADAHFRRYLELQPEGKHAEEAQERLLKAVADAPVLPVLRKADAVGAVDPEPSYQENNL